MVMRVKKAGIILFFITVLSMLVLESDNIPMVGLISKFRYLYLVFIWSCLLVLKPYWHKKVSLIMALLVGYILLFGYVFANPIVIGNIHGHAKEMLLFVLMSFGTAHFIKLYDARKEFLIAVALAHCIFIVWAFLTHPCGIDLIKYVLLLPKIVLMDVGNGRFYGTSSYNAIGNIISSAIWFLLLVYSNNRKEEDVFLIKKDQQSLAGIFLFCFLFAVLCTTTSRGELLSFILGGMIWFGMIWKVYVGNKSNRFFQNMMIGSSYMVLLLYICKSVMFSAVSGRSDNWEINWISFQRMGRYLTGMGYVNPWSFLMKSFPGYTTYACDVYWYYVFFSTGILGSSMLFVILVLLFIEILKHRTNNYLYDCTIKTMVPVIIFNNFFHATFLSYNYISSVFVLTFLLEFLME